MAQGIGADISSTSRGRAAVVGLSVIAGLGHNFVFRLVGLVRGGEEEIEEVAKLHL